MFKGGETETEKSEKNIVRATLAVCEPLVPVTVRLRGFGTPFTAWSLVAERPLTVTVLLWPGVIEAGSNAQVTPVEQESVMALVKELGPEAETAKVVEVVPICITLDRVLAASVKTAVPVPLSETVA